MANGTKPQRGVIRRIVKDEHGKPKGFGFITGADGKDYFFHRSALGRGRTIGELAEGQAVNYVPGEPTDRGERADRVWLD